ncbi:MAG: MFS transporter [Alphaproteobacteria bacterium]|nr:MFS transporter [Alphaproteobacteria bacterium]MBV8548944.1 MFS transporter [Alphaproteobacteria bacterium]
MRQPEYLKLWIGRLCAYMGYYAQAVTIGWQVYTIARLTRGVEESAFLVGMVGLAQFLPLFALSFISGEMVDRHDRRRILVLCWGFQTLASIALMVMAWMGVRELWPVFLVAVVVGASRSFTSPSTSAIQPMLIPRDMVTKAVAWGMFTVQGGRVFGPWLGGLLCAVSVTASYAVSGVLLLGAATAIAMITADTKPRHKPTGNRLEMIREGLDYVWKNKLVLGAISLDLFTVLFGSVVSLLPVYARDILQVGPEGFGLLRSADSIGGAILTTYITTRPLRRNAGLWMLGSTVVFGAATLLFAVSTNLWFSVVMIAIFGAADAVSNFIRHSLLQIAIPDAMRGRVSAVSGVFVSASNELGEFESGVAARFMGPVGSALFGGAMAMLVAVAWAKIFPALRKADTIEAAE